MRPGAPYPAGAAPAGRETVPPPASSREFALVCRLDSKAAEDRELPRRLEKQIQDHGFHVCLAGEQDVKRILAVYYQQNVVTEHFEQVDGERWVTDHG